jgi:hypothetical protein
MAEPLYRLPSRSEIISLAADEGHDADIPTNAGSIPPTPLEHPPHKHTHPGMTSSALFDKDLEKGSRPESINSDDGAEDQADNEAEVENDPDIVWWDGPDDPQNPMNWRYTKKWGTVALVSAITFLTPLASSSFAPGVPKVMATFHSSDDMLEGFMVSVYVLGFAFGPLSMSGLLTEFEYKRLTSAI